MVTEEEKIESLIRDDYGLPVLQLLIAEIIYKTQDYNSEDLHKRFDKAMKAIMGEPTKKEKYIGNLDDEKLLIEAASLVKSCDYSISGACLHVAKRELIPNYRHPYTTLKEFKDRPKKADKIFDDLPDHERQAVDSCARRLRDKLSKQDISKYAAKKLKMLLIDLDDEEELLEEPDYVRDLIENWLKLFGVNGENG